MSQVLAGFCCDISEWRIAITLVGFSAIAHCTVRAAIANVITTAAGLAAASTAKAQAGASHVSRSVSNVAAADPTANVLVAAADASASSIATAFSS